MDPNSSFAVCRIDDGDDGADAVSVITDDAGNVVGFNVEVLVLTGAYANMRIVAALTAPVGSELPDLPQPGTTLLVAFTNHTPDVGAYIVGQVPGGTRAIPKATAGVDVAGDGLKSFQVVCPPKGTGYRIYLRGGDLVVRLKGKQKDYVSQVFFEFDDGSFFRGSWDPSSNGIGWSMKDSKGAFVSVTGGAIQMISPGKATLFELTDDGITLSSDKLINIQGAVVRADGAICLAMPPGVPPSPANAAIAGTSGATGVASTKVFIGF